MKGANRKFHVPSDSFIGRFEGLHIKLERLEGAEQMCKLFCRDQGKNRREPSDGWLVHTGRYIQMNTFFSKTEGSVQD